MFHFVGYFYTTVVLGIIALLTVLVMAVSIFVGKTAECYEGLCQGCFVVYTMAAYLIMFGGFNFNDPHVKVVIAIAIAFTLVIFALLLLYGAKELER